MKRCLWLFSVFALLAMLAIARAQDVTAQFPEAAQVVADYPDDTQRFVALNTLWDWLHAKAPQDFKAQQRRKSYYEASTAIRQRYIASVTEGQAFDEQAHQLDTPSFERSVLQHYHVLDVAAQPVPEFHAQTGDVTDSMIQNGFLMATPFIVGGLVAMYVLCYMMLRSGPQHLLLLPPPPGPFNLPDALRLVNVPGMSYEIEVQSGLVLHKETNVRTVTTTHTTPTETQVIGNQVYTTPGQTTTNTTSTRTDTLWVRRPDGREEAWTFTSVDTQARPGHVLSVLRVRQPNGDGPQFIAYNHDLAHVAPMAGIHGSKSCLAWVLAFLVGTVAFAIAVAVIMSIDHDFSTLNREFLPFVYLILGAMASLVASTVMVFWVSSGFVRRRDAAFLRCYMPGIRNWLDSATPRLKRHFGV